MLAETFDDECDAERRIRALLERMLCRTATVGSANAPTSLMSGVWVTETAGFASVPPRAESDLGETIERELMVARGESDEPRAHDTEKTTPRS
jgi:hypothetical protein